MDVIYLLTNTTKKEGRRYYVGSKQDCVLFDLDGVPTLISTKSNRPYYGSSQSQEMKDDMLNGDVLSASILEKVDRSKTTIYSREEFWLNHHNAVESSSYYNISNALMTNRNQEDIVNIYGETFKQVSTRNSAVSRRDAEARRLGYDDFSRMAVHFWERISSGESASVISSSIGKHRKYVSRYLSPFSKGKFLSDVESIDLNYVRDMYRKGATIVFIAESLSTDTLTVRYLIGDYSLKNTVAKGLCMSNGELEDHILREVVDEDKTFSAIASELGISKSSVSRYFVSAVKRRLKSSDFNEQNE